MLQELRVEELAIVDRLAVRFARGLNVLTGETGAGKSLLVDALALAVGGRASADAVRAGAREGTVEALFAADTPEAGAALDAALEARGLPSASGQLVIKRVVSAAGRHRVYVNGGLATVAMLAEVAGGLVDISGQHEQMALLKPGAHLALLDDAAGDAGARGRYAEAWAALEAARAELSRLDTDASARAEREAFLRFQLRAIDEVAPGAGELESLEAEGARLKHADRLREAAAFAEAALYTGDGAVVDVLGRVSSRLSEAMALDPALGPVVEGLRGALAVVEDHGRELGGYLEHLEADPARLDVVQERLAALTHLCRRHGGDVDGVLAAAEAMRDELETLDRHEDRLAEATAQVASAEAEARAAAAVLSRGRRRAAKKLAAEVTGTLAALGMAATRFEVRVEAAALSASGADRVEMQMAPGPEEPLRPLSRVASGGELSRIQLAIERALAGRDPVPTVVFDEVDAGIGGATAEVVGRLLAGVAADRQVLCITHLPQVAAQAAHHLVVEKEVRDGRARVEVRAVEAEARRDEVARMLGGLSITERSRAHADEMLDRARSVAPARAGGGPAPGGPGGPRRSPPKRRSRAA